MSIEYGDDGHGELPDGGRLPTPVPAAKHKAVAKAAVDAVHRPAARASMAAPPAFQAAADKQALPQQASQGGQPSQSVGNTAQGYVDYDDDDNDHAGGDGNDTDAEKDRSGGNLVAA